MTVKRCSPVVMRKCLELVEALKIARIKFIPIPIMSEEDRVCLLDIFKGRIERISNQTEGAKYPNYGKMIIKCGNRKCDWEGPEKAMEKIVPETETELFNHTTRYICPACGSKNKIYQRNKSIPMMILAGVDKT